MTACTTITHRPFVNKSRALIFEVTMPIADYAMANFKSVEAPDKSI